MRPKKEEKKETNLVIRLTKAERKLIEEKSKKTGLTYTQLVLKSIEEKELINRLTDEEKEILKDLISLRNQLIKIDNYIRFRMDDAEELRIIYHDFVVLLSEKTKRIR